MQRQIGPWGWARTMGATCGRVVALLVLISSPLAAQESAEEWWGEIFRGTASVDIVNLEVRVTDEDGEVVRGLDRGDFELRVDGRTVEMSNFLAVDERPAGGPIFSIARPPEAAASAEERPAGAPAPEKEPPFLVIYVDNANLAEIQRGRVLEAIESLLGETQGPLRAMVVTNDRGLVVRQPFTTSRGELLDALEEAGASSAIGKRFEADRRRLIQTIEDINVDAAADIFDDLKVAENAANEAETLMGSALAQIRAYSQERYQHTLETLAVLRGVVEVAGGLPGRKAVLVVSGGLPLRPGAAMFEAFSRRFAAVSSVSRSFRPEMEGSRDDATPQLEEILDAANAARVAFYVLDASEGRLSRQASAAGRGRAGGVFGGWDDQLASMEQADNEASLQRMADVTGGRFGSTATSWTEVLEGLDEDWATYYSLGLPAELFPDSENRDVEVSVLRDGLRVQHRSGLRKRTQRERTVDATRSALLLDTVANPFGIGVAADLPQPMEDGHYLVQLAVRVPLGSLVLLPGEAQHAGKVRMYVAVRDDLGRTSEVAEHLCPIQIPNANMLTTLGQSAICGVRLKMRSGPQRVAVSVLDEIAAVESTAFLNLDVGAELSAGLSN